MNLPILVDASTIFQLLARHLSEMTTVKQIAEDLFPPQTAEPHI
jgi:hypothetical protein